MFMEGIDEATMEVLKYVTLEEGTKLNSVQIPSCHMSARLVEKFKDRISFAIRGGTYFGQWKVGQLDDEIARMHTSLTNIPYLSGYSPEM